MPTLRLEGSQAAGTSETNLLAGSKFEMLPFPAVVTIYGVMDTADAGSVTVDFTMGNVVEIDGAAVPTFTSPLGPDMDKHLLGRGVSARHDRLQLKLVNSDAVNAAAYRFLIDIRPI